MARAWWRQTPVKFIFAGRLVGWLVGWTGCCLFDQSCFGTERSKTVATVSLDNRWSTVRTPLEYGWSAAGRPFYSFYQQ